MLAEIRNVAIESGRTADFGCDAIECDAMQRTGPSHDEAQLSGVVAVVDGWAVRGGGGGSRLQSTAVLKYVDCLVRSELSQKWR